METPQQHGGMVYRQMTIVSSAKTVSKKLFKQITPLFALDFSTKVVFIKQNFALIKYNCAFKHINNKTGFNGISMLN